MKSKPTDERSTPDRIFAALTHLYGPFDLDAASTHANTKCQRHFTAAEDGLLQAWFGRVWLNPPYSRGSLAVWLAKARAEVLAGRADSVCCLIPAATAEVWWRDQVMAPGGAMLHCTGLSRVSSDKLGATVRLRWPDLETDILFLTGRVRFAGESGAKFGSAVVVFRKPVKRGRGRPRKTAEGSRWTRWREAVSGAPGLTALPTSTRRAG